MFLPDEARCLPERKKDYFTLQKWLTIKIEKEVAMIHVEGVEDSSGNRKELDSARGTDSRGRRENRQPACQLFRGVSRVAISDQSKG